MTEFSNSTGGASLAFVATVERDRQADRSHPYREKEVIREVNARPEVRLTAEQRRIRRLARGVRRARRGSLRRPRSRTLQRKVVGRAGQLRGTSLMTGTASMTR